uniref:Uncharacterized protein n=1 Tax=Yersinia enterocolitica TaxID=630 RepID=B0RKR3_YEREN|nr:hypothetical protein [Yersinia enterocolitica]
MISHWRSRITFHFIMRTPSFLHFHLGWQLRWKRIKKNQKQLTQSKQRQWGRQEGSATPLTI